MTSQCDLQSSVLAAIEDAKRRPRRKRNPHYRPDPQRDRGVQFTALCAQLAEIDVADVAAWQGTDFDQKQKVEKAREARAALDAFLALCGGQT